MPVNIECLYICANKHNYIYKQPSLVSLAILVTSFSSLNISHILMKHILLSPMYHLYYPPHHCSMWVGLDVFPTPSIFLKLSHLPLLFLPGVTKNLLYNKTSLTLYNTLISIWYQVNSFGTTPSAERPLSCVILCLHWCLCHMKSSQYIL